MKRTLLSFTLMLIAGCAYVPQKVKVTDLSSGKTFTTYAGYGWSKENMLGYNFYDIESGQLVMLKNYTTAPLTRGGMMSPEEPDAVQFNLDRNKVLAKQLP